MSRGLQKRASATVVLKPFSSNIFAASKDSYNLAPKDKIAIVLPFFIIRPLPIANGSMVLLNFKPILFPLGYLNAEGLSFILEAVRTIRLSSCSSEAAINTILGIFAKNAISNEPA